MHLCCDEPNLLKHYIGFDDAQALWDDPWLQEVPAKTDDEPRYLAIGQIKDKAWTAVWTPRGDAVRIISVRRARKEEIKHYESNRV